MLALTSFHNWFKSSIHKWLQIVHERSCDRIRKAVDMDQVREGPSYSMTLTEHTIPISIHHFIVILNNQNISDFIQPSFIYQYFSLSNCVHLFIYMFVIY